MSSQSILTSKKIKNLKVLVVGYGSMGRRRIRLLKELAGDVEVVCVDSSPKRREQARKAGLEGYADLGLALKKEPDIAFVCTSPGHHAEIILELIGAGVHVFTELNLTDDRYDLIIRRASEKDSKVFMSSTFLYNKQIEKIKELINKTKKPLTYIYHVGQYLPDWHPWENYRDFFIGKKETNGVREIFAIQLPWLIDVFGKIESAFSVSHRCTGLDIEFNDSTIATFRHENGNIGVFEADVVSRKAVTSLEVIGEDVHIAWNGHHDDLRAYDVADREWKWIKGYEEVEHMEEYADNIIEDQYRDEIMDFLDMVYFGKTPRYSLEQDRYTLSIINEIEGLGK